MSVPKIEWESFYNLAGNGSNVSVVGMAYVGAVGNVRVLQWATNRCLEGAASGFRVYWGTSPVRKRFVQRGSKAGTILTEPRGEWRPDFFAGFGGGPWPIWTFFGTANPAVVGHLTEDTAVALAGFNGSSYYLLHPPRLWWQFSEALRGEGDPNDPTVYDDLEVTLPPNFQCT